MRKKITAVAGVLTLVTGAIVLGPAGPASATGKKAPKFDYWKHAIVEVFEYKGQAFSERFIGAGAHVYSKQAINGCAGQYAAHFEVDIARGRYTSAQGLHPLPHTIFRSVLNTQQWWVLSENYDDGWVKGRTSPQRIKKTIAKVRALKPAVLNHMAGGDQAVLMRELRARRDATDLEDYIGSHVAQAVQWSAGNPTDVDVTSLDMTSPAALNGYVGATADDPFITGRWGDNLAPQSEHDGSFCSFFEPPTELAYKRAIAVTGTVAAWVATLTDRTDGYSVTYSSTTGKLTDSLGKTWSPVVDD